VGETLQNDFKDFRIQRIIGRGGMSVVYLAEQVSLGRKVALKVMSPALADDPAFRDRFVRESRTAASLDHPNIIPIFEAGESDGVLYIAMRYVEGSDLRTLQKRLGAMPVERVLSIIGQVASALDAAHAKGLVHRDVKPANVLVVPAEQPGGLDHAYLADFGLTREAEGRTGLTQTGQFVGTVDYAAPEQIYGKQIDGRTDQYALGCMLFECLTGTVPFQKTSNVAVIYSHVNDPPPKPTERRAELPGAIDAVVAKAMSKEKEDRYPTCAALADAARSALSGVVLAPVRVRTKKAKQPKQVRPAVTERTPKQPRAGRRIPRWAIPAALVVLAVAVAAPFLLKTHPRAAVVAVPSWITYQLEDKRIFRIQDRVGAQPEDLSPALSRLPDGALPKGSTDEGIGISSNGKWLGIVTPRFGCDGWACLVILPADLSRAEVVRALPLHNVNDDGKIHSEGFAISPDGSQIVFRSGGGPHERDLWLIKRQGNSDWTAPLLLTEKLGPEDAKKFKFVDLDNPTFSHDGKRVVFDCHKKLYLPFALCQTLLNAPSDYRVLVDPAAGPSAAKDSYAGHPSFAADDTLFFEAAWQGIGDNVWRMDPGVGPLRTLLHLVTPQSAERDGAPCALSDGRIASMWRADHANGDLPALKTMTKDGTDARVLVRTTASASKLIDWSAGCG